DTMIQVSDQLFQFYAQIVQNQGQNTEKSVIEIVNKLRQLARENAEDLPKVSLADDGVESGTEADGSGTKAIPLNSDRAKLLSTVKRTAEQALNQAIAAGGAETDDILMQNMKLRSLLSTKR
ncbi:hypothetical protein TELCIR_21364, partial [Teladorsagia circumcincta]